MRCLFLQYNRKDCYCCKWSVGTDGGKVHWPSYVYLMAHWFTTYFFSPTGPSLTVTVMTSGTTYHVATSVTLICQVGLEAVQPVSYQWSSSCTGQCSIDGQTDDTITISLLRSTDSGTHTCTVTDNVGNSGNGSLNFNVTGKFAGEERRILWLIAFFISVHRCCTLLSWVNQQW